MAGRTRSSEVGCSPRTRGWSRRSMEIPGPGSVLPSHAGMVPCRPGGTSCGNGAPRARGDGPVLVFPGRAGLECSPRTRGWSRRHRTQAEGTAVLPAHAGMVPVRRPGSEATVGAPRARGDGPGKLTARIRDAVCSPRTRGWSPELAGVQTTDAVLPAHAGMAPKPPCPRVSRRRAPRARGDGPRGGTAHRRPPLCSPRTRGWSHDPLHAPVVGAVLPAHAGMTLDLYFHRPSAQRVGREGHVRGLVALVDLHGSRLHDPYSQVDRIDRPDRVLAPSLHGDPA